jgi:2-oxoglutarate dehydrogenase E2 component (dihydrolipoamide succinyltransferase)
MAKFELKLPKMGESVAEATVTNWLKSVGEKIEADEAVLEIATDKVDSEVPSEVSGTLTEILFQVNDVVKVGQTIAIIETEGVIISATTSETITETVPSTLEVSEADAKPTTDNRQLSSSNAAPADFKSSDKFYSPLVKNIATAEGISVAELESIAGTGKDGRVTKEDILKYIAIRQKPFATSVTVQPTTDNRQPTTQAVPVSVNGGDEIVEMDRMRKLISGYMVASVQTSAHVQSFIEVDVTNIVKWRDRVKNAFEQREGEKLTFTPIFMEAVAKALKDFPGLNISVDGDFIIKRKNINLGMAAALPNGNLIVPVIKNADQLNLVGMAKAVNDLGNRAKAGKLKPDDTQGGTYTVTNVGTFGSVFGTPIINQPQVGILALGAIRKVPAVIETPEGDFIGIRQKMFLSHSYDHRVVDGALGGSFVKRVADYLEAFDVNREY